MPNQHLVALQYPGRVVPPLALLERLVARQRRPVVVVMVVPPRISAAAAAAGWCRRAVDVSWSVARLPVLLERGVGLVRRLLRLRMVGGHLVWLAENGLGREGG